MPTGYFRQTAPPPLAPVRLDERAAPIWCKLEFLNPSGSTKDRIAGYILSKAWHKGEIQRGSSVVEASSGSTSIAMAMVCAQMGLKFVAVMPEGASEERVLMIRACGGEVKFTPKAEGIHGALLRAAALAQVHNAFTPLQFENPDNAAAHRFGTAVEIFKQVPEGRVDVIVSGVGTGGTLVGLVHGCQDHGCAVTAVVARPVQSMTAAGETTAPRGFADVECCSFSSRIPGVVDRLSKIYLPERMPKRVEVEIEDEYALRVTRRLIALGFPVGPSSGLNFAAALEFQRRADAPMNIVTVFPDRMERYFSTDLFVPLRSPGTSL